MPLATSRSDKGPSNRDGSKFGWTITRQQFAVKRSPSAIARRKMVDRSFRKLKPRELFKSPCKAPAAESKARDAEGVNDPSWHVHDHGLKQRSHLDVARKLLHRL